MAERIESRQHGRWHGGRRTAVHVASEREAERLARTLGAEVASARRARRWTQTTLGSKVGLSQSRISSIEDGLGAGAPIGVWIALGLVLDRPFAASLSRSVAPEPVDAGHLAGEELLLALARRNGRNGAPEIPTRFARTARVIDVAVRDDRQRVLIVQELSNRIDDLGQTIRNHRQKVIEGAELATAIGGDDGPFRVAFCWVVRATAANRALVARYPEVIANAVPGSSRAWVRALVEGGPIPREPGLVWVDVAGTRLSEHRRHAWPAPHRPRG